MIQFIKQFLEWLPVKKQLDNQFHKPPLFKEGEVWWCYIGENVGVEISGKNSSFTRPILIIKKYNQYSFFGLPLTTKEKTGTWYVPIELNNKHQIVILSQGRVFDYRRLKEKMGQVAEIYLAVIGFAHAGLHSSSRQKIYMTIH